MKTTAIAVLISFSILASARGQDSTVGAKEEQTAAPRTAAGCGPSNIEFDVKTDGTQHPVSRPEPGKALVYFMHVESQDGGVINKGWVTTRVGIDGAWVGANHGRSYFFLSVNPGEHAVCTDWQSRRKTYSRQAAALSFTAEAGKTYYLRTTVMESPFSKRHRG